MRYGSITELYGHYANDYTKHYFKGETAVPWLKKTLGSSRGL